MSNDENEEEFNDIEINEEEYVDENGEFVGDFEENVNTNTKSEGGDGDENPTPEKIVKEIESIKNEVRKKEEIENVKTQIEREIDAPLKITVTQRNGEVINVDPEKDRIFCVYCKQCKSYRDKLSFRSAKRLKKALEHYGCVCNSKEFGIKTNEFIEICREFDIPVKPLDPKLVNYIFDRVILPSIDIVKENVD